MEKLVKELKSALTNDSISLESILLKAKVLGYDLDNKQLINWVNLEINGYHEMDSEVPFYRSFVTAIYGVMTNGYTRYNHTQIPTIHIQENIRELLTNTKVRSGISEIEHIVSDDKSENLINPIPLEMLVYINKDIPTNGFIVEAAQREIPKSSFKGVLTSVRAKLLDFVLELDKEYDSIENAKEDSENVDKMLSTTIYGNNNVVITGSHNTQEAKIINKNNIEELQKLLRDANVPEEDVTELAEIVQDEEADFNKNEFGPKVKGWIKKIMNKAVDGTLNLSFSTAGQLINTAISNYYGL